MSLLGAAVRGLGRRAEMNYQAKAIASAIADQQRGVNTPIIDAGMKKGLKRGLWVVVILFSALILFVIGAVAIASLVR
jgi:hypothetical protein